MRHVYPGQEDFFEVHEVYYGEDGEVLGYTDNGSGPCGESLKEIEEDLVMMAKALELPILDYDDEGFVPTDKPQAN
jgi:hypothetical protein